MMKTTMSVLLFSTLASAHQPLSQGPVSVLTNLDQAKAVGGHILSVDSVNNLAVSQLNPEQLDKLSMLNHFQGRCGGFEVLTAEEVAKPAQVLQNLMNVQLKMAPAALVQAPALQWQESYQRLADMADPNTLRQTVQWISSFPSRNDKLTNPNQHVLDLKSKLETWLSDAPWPYQIDFVAHKSTRQQSVRLTIPGKKKPQEIVVLGGHFDSVVMSYLPGAGGGRAPGADDNASGSSNLIEAVKILKNSAQPERTLEFYWYAGEESGLLGSAEIAKDSRAQNRQVIAVLQLDMTLFPGSGQQVVGLINDFTSPWLRSLFTEINDTYVKATLVDDACGYGCSDHASWHRQNFHAVIPFEATSRTMNRAIHSENDIINSKSSFDHSNSFTKYAVLFALVLGNSDLRAP